MTREEAIKFAEYAQIMADGNPDVQEFCKLAESALRAQQELESKLRVLESSDMFDEDGGEILNDETVTDRHQMTNADRIRAMTDEEIAEWVCENGAIKTPCDIICGGDCKALATFDKSSMDVCKKIVMKWLQQPTEEEKA